LERASRRSGQSACRTRMSSARSWTAKAASERCPSASRRADPARSAADGRLLQPSGRDRSTIRDGWLYTGDIATVDATATTRSSTARKR
jgi:hypothetical protein